MKEKIVTSNGYAFALFSKDVVKETLKDAKIKNKNLAKLFDESDEFANLMMSTGAILPVVTESMNDYFFDVYSEKSSLFKSSEWELLKEEKPFNLKVLDNEIWICSISILCNWNYNIFDTQDNIIGYETLDGIEGNTSFIYEAQKIEIDTAIYNVTVQGYKRTKLSNNRERNYGFGFKMVRTDNLIPLNEISKDNTFNID